eukprot:662700_1
MMARLTPTELLIGTHHETTHIRIHMFAYVPMHSKEGKDTDQKEDEKANDTHKDPNVCVRCLLTCQCILKKVKIRIKKRMKRLTIRLRIQMFAYDVYKEDNDTDYRRKKSQEFV